MIYNPNDTSIKLSCLELNLDTTIESYELFLIDNEINQGDCCEGYPEEFCDTYKPLYHEAPNTYYIEINEINDDYIGTITINTESLPLSWYEARAQNCSPCNTVENNYCQCQE